MTSPQESQTGAPNVLLVEDDADLAAALSAGLEEHGLSVQTADNAELGSDVLRRSRFDAIVTDIRMPGMDGLTFAERVQADWAVPVIVLTGYRDTDAAIKALRVGVHDFLIKPVDAGELTVAVQSAIQRHETRTLVQSLQGDLDPDEWRTKEDLGIIGDSEVMQNLKRLIRQVASADVPVLITGESGSGKELVARALHAAGRHPNEPFVPVNCAALPEPLLESELFGHVKGAFTGAETAQRGLFVSAGSGTILLDEVGDLPMSMQPKLLRALQEGTVRPVGGSEEQVVRARLVAATNRDLEDDVQRKKFREDLFYRINVVRLHVPPLRERGTDVLRLAQHFVDVYARDLGRSVRGFSVPFAERVMAYHWPGNIRELSNRILRAVALAQKDHLTVRDLPDELRPAPPNGSASERYDALALSDLERLHIERVLKECEGNKAQAARVLGIDRRTLYRKLRRYSDRD